MSEEEFYLSVKDKTKNGFIVYCSSGYKLSEIDLINIIKILVVDGRSRIIGRKILEVYKDSTKDRTEITQKRLEMIGIKSKENGKPEHTSNPKSK